MVPKYLLGEDLEGVHTIPDKTRSQYNQLQLAGTEFLSDTLLASGNIYWRNLDQSTFNGDLNDEFVMMMPLKKENVLRQKKMKMRVL